MKKWIGLLLCGCLAGCTQTSSPETTSALNRLERDYTIEEIWRSNLSCGCGTTMIFRVGIFATMNFFRVGIVLPTFFYPFQT